MTLQRWEYLKPPCSTSNWNSKPTTGANSPRSKDHCLMSSLSVSAFHTRATGASKVRSTTSGSSFVTTLSFAAIFLLLALNFMRLVLALQLLEIAVQPFEALLPVAPVILDTVGDVLEVLGHGRKADLEGLGQCQDRGFARGEAREDRPPRGIGEGGKGGAEAIGRHVQWDRQLSRSRI